LLIDELLIYCFKVKASDLHLTVGVPPMVRILGELRPVPNLPVLTPDESRAMITSLMTEKQINKLERDREIDFAFAFKNVGRFRINSFFQKGYMGCVIRMVPDRIPTLQELQLPAVVASVTDMKRGLVLFTGPTGCGKSSSLASILDIINRNRPCHIMTVEDPIEFVHQHKKSVINQRELGTDTLEYKQALKHVLRQDPDVILVGEMRDLETIALAITAAETGHLVFSTLHTQDTPQTIDRIIDVFPPYQQSQIRLQLSNTLKAIFAQQLLKRSDGSGRVPAVEVLINNAGVANIIREGKIHQLYSVLQTSYREGMQTMDASIKDLYMRGFITREEAVGHVHNLAEFQQLVSGGVYAEV